MESSEVSYEHGIEPLKDREHLRLHLAHAIFNLQAVDGEFLQYLTPPSQLPRAFAQAHRIIEF